MTRADALAVFAAGVLVGLLVSSVNAAEPPRPAVHAIPGDLAPTTPTGTLAPRTPAATSVVPSPTPTGTRPAGDGADPDRIPSGSITGIASWYPADGLIAAAGPELRHELGKGWRGSRVTVCASSRSAEACVRVRISDWCQCMRGEADERLVDLSDDAFRRLRGLSVGLVRVEVER